MNTTTGLPGQIRFHGSASASLFTQEIEASYCGVLTRNMVTDPVDPMAGFVSASIDGRPWTGTMWTRDAGVFLRELVQWGYLEHACMLTQNLMQLVDRNDKGYYTFPERFDYGHSGSGSELDGTGAIIIGMVLLWERLVLGHPVRERIAHFLIDPTSPLAYILDCLSHAPLIQGSGEFGGGCGIAGEFFNVVQNNLVRLALLAAARMMERMGDTVAVQTYLVAAEQLSTNMQRYLRSEDGTWVWCIDPSTMRGDATILDHIINRGFGGINGVLSMSADVLGFDLMSLGWEGTTPSARTFDKLYSHPKRRAMFEKYGAWTQFDEFGMGYFTGPSYGHGYALQAMLLLDRMTMAERALDFLADATRRPPRGNVLTRDCDDYFYERYYLPELADASETELLARQPGFPLHTHGHLDEGCGALNLVCVAEPLKVARLIVGVDDTATDLVRLIPRLPPSWAGYEATHWPILTQQGVVHADLRCERTSAGVSCEISVLNGDRLPHLAVRLKPSMDRSGYTMVEDVKEGRFSLACD